jgi:8-oxo-dGTP pyrophosphatase MutT (NUDIX family)
MGRDEPEVLLVTSRETKRWILPKGNPKKHKKSYEVAAEEAFEEAGLKGKASQKPFYTFDSYKRLGPGKMVPCRVRVFSLAVKREHVNWPEKGERERAWMTFAEAAHNAGEAGLVLLFLDLAADPDLALLKIVPSAAGKKKKSKAKEKVKVKVKRKLKPAKKPKKAAKKPAKKPKGKASKPAIEKSKAKKKKKPAIKAASKAATKSKPKQKSKNKTKAKKGAS